MTSSRSALLINFLLTKNLTPAFEIKNSLKSEVQHFALQFEMPGF